MQQQRIFLTALLIGGALATASQAQLLGGGVGGSIGGLGDSLNGGLSGATSGALASGLSRGSDIGQIVSRARDAAGNTVTATKDARGRLIYTTRDARGHLVTDARLVVDRSVETLGTATAITRDVVVVVPQVSLSAVDLRRRETIVASGVTALQAQEAGVYMDRQVVALQRDLTGTGVEVVKRGEKIILVLPSEVTFAFNKSDIQARFRPVLDAVARTLIAYPATFVDVAGHTDDVGSDAYNQRLSERRAGSVGGYLESRGALPGRVIAEGRGEAEPVASNATVYGRAANRRVEIELRPVTG